MTTAEGRRPTARVRSDGESAAAPQWGPSQLSRPASRPRVTGRTGAYAARAPSREGWPAGASRPATPASPRRHPRGADQYVTPRGPCRSYGRSAGQPASPPRRTGTPPPGPAGPPRQAGPRRTRRGPPGRPTARPPHPTQPYPHPGQAHRDSPRRPRPAGPGFNVIAPRRRVLPTDEAREGPINLPLHHIPQIRRPRCPHQPGTVPDLLWQVNTHHTPPAHAASFPDCVDGPVAWRRDPHRPEAAARVPPAQPAATTTAPLLVVSVLLDTATPPPADCATRTAQHLRTSLRGPSHASGAVRRQT